MIRTRFAPSPTGPLHLGHAYSAILAHDFAKARGGEFLVRIEDLDQSRSRSEWEIKIFDDLKWLGLSWITPIMRQSQRASSYEIAINKEKHSKLKKDLKYNLKQTPLFDTRKYVINLEKGYELALKSKMNHEKAHHIEV